MDDLLTIRKIAVNVDAIPDNRSSELIAMGISNIDS